MRSPACSGSCPEAHCVVCSVTLYVPVLGYACPIQMTGGIPWLQTPLKLVASTERPGIPEIAIDCSPPASATTTTKVPSVVIVNVSEAEDAAAELLPPNDEVYVENWETETPPIAG